VIGTSKPEKDWIPQRWAEVADALYADYGLQPVLVGGRSPAELETERRIVELASHPPLSTLGIPLRELVGVLDASSLAISLDTGPLHMAVALGRPVVSLIGHLDPRRAGPYRRYHDLLIDAYHDRDEVSPISATRRKGRMQRIAVSDVLEKVELWKERYASRPKS
jgi:heptosyltransferase I